MIDIIIPCYNAHNTINRALASVAMQDIVDELTVTLVDDCSEFDYKEYVDFWSRVLTIQQVQLPENGGPGVARQAGLDETDGEFIVFMDADDTLATSYALRQMKTAMEKETADIVCGQFIEECEEGFIPHKGDLVWVFAKMYRRKTIERFLVRFNDTRANEDTGFNTLLGSLTDRVVYIPQTVYEWHWSESTITRKQNGAYTWATGHRGYVSNMLWVIEELRKRNVNKEIIRSLAVKCLCNMYFMHENVMANAPWEADASNKAISEFYKKAIQPIVKDGALPFVYIAENFKDVQASANGGIIYTSTFRDWLKALGYYKDEKKVS